MLLFKNMETPRLTIRSWQKSDKDFTLSLWGDKENGKYTYTVLRKLCEKGLLQNRDGIVSSLVPREEFYSAKSEQIIEDSYQGSLPAFVASFISRKNISAEEADEIQRMIDSFRKEG